MHSDVHFTITIYQIEPEGRNFPVDSIPYLQRRPRLKRTIYHRIEQHLMTPLSPGHVYSAHVWRESHGGSLRLRRGVRFHVANVSSRPRGFRVIPL